MLRCCRPGPAANSFLRAAAPFQHKRPSTFGSHHPSFQMSCDASSTSLHPVPGPRASLAVFEDEVFRYGRTRRLVRSTSASTGARLGDVGDHGRTTARRPPWRIFIATLSMFAPHPARYSRHPVTLRGRRPVPVNYDRGAPPPEPFWRFGRPDTAQSPGRPVDDHYPCLAPFLFIR